MQTQKLLLISVFAACVGVLSGCANALDCVLNGDNFKGRIGFRTGVPIQPGPLVVQTSSNSFTSVVNTNTDNNSQGLVSVPYSFCVDAGTAYQVRAFEDLNGNGVLDAGEPNGRYDGTDTGDAAFISKTVTKNSDNSYSRVEGADFIIDNAY